MNSPNIDSPLMTNAEAMAYCRIKDPRVLRRGYLERAFSAICSGRLYPVFSRQTNPIAISILKASCSLKESFRAARFTSSSIVSVSLTGTVFRNFSSFFIKNKLHAKFILDNP